MLGKVFEEFGQMLWHRSTRWSKYNQHQVSQLSTSPTFFGHLGLSDKPQILS